jgi:hypothetical protein
MARCKSRGNNTSSNNSNKNSDNTGMIVIIVFALSVCCIFSSVISSIIAYFMLQKEELPFDKSVFEYRTKDGQKIISPKDLPLEIKDAYYLNLPAGNKNYQFIGKKCYNGVCDTLELKNTPAMNLYYDDGNLMSGKLSYKT